MPPQIQSPAMEISIEPLHQDTFAPFGTVVQNPTRNSVPTAYKLDSVSANQGSATKYLDVSQLTNHYDLSTSKKPAKPVVNMFTCKPRVLTSSSGHPVFNVEILERHPYTPQTFIPLGLPASHSKTKYLVIVAPTLPISPRSSTTNTDADARLPPYPQPERRSKKRRAGLRNIYRRARPSPFTNTRSPPDTEGSYGTSSLNPYGEGRVRGGGMMPKGKGMPDLSRLRAFIADGSQAVTYGPGTWHAPMVVLGDSEVDFVVVQYANGVGIEDCQEVEIQKKEGAGGEIRVLLDGSGFGQIKAKL